jgi:ribonucleotide reductase beta subunit family protein with ferritin-like domain
MKLSYRAQFYAVQIMMEAVHSEQYALIVFYIFKDTEKNKLFNAITIPAVKER